MSQAQVFLWLGTASARLLLGTEIHTWADVHARTLRAPSAPALAEVRPYDPLLVQSIERDLEHARISASSLDEARAFGVLASVQATLHAHPELPQAAWFYAEALAVEIELKRARGDSDAVISALALRRRALEGDRARRVSEAPLEEVQTALETQPIALVGAAPQDEVEWNGLASDRGLEVAAGEHHIRVLRGGRLVWAEWVTVSPGLRSLALAVPAIASCSEDDFLGVHFGPRGVQGTDNVRCPAWVAAREGPDGLLLSECQGAHCGAVENWSTQDAAAAAQASTRKPASEKRSYAPHVIVASVLSATVAGILLWQLDAFGSTERTTSPWVFGGVKSAGAAFSQGF
jgi:hypothetical protein